MYEINMRYLSKAIAHNSFIQKLVGEYLECDSANQKDECKNTPLGILSPIISMWHNSGNFNNDNYDTDCELRLLRSFVHIF